MNWNNQRAKIVCPYYASHSYPRKGTRPTVTCEKPEQMDEYDYLQLKFANYKVRDEYINTYCACGYWYCAMYRMLTEYKESQEGK